MKVTAIIPDELVKELRKHSNSKTLTDCLIHAITEWVSITKIKQLNEQVAKSPLKFAKKYDAKSVRVLNRKSRD